MKTASLARILWFCMAGSVFGQPSGTALTFEVASVKPSAEARGAFIRYLPGGGLRVAGATLKNLIAMAYGVREFLVFDGPAWLDTERFDIQATATYDAAQPGTDPAERGDEQHKVIERLRSLLADRFQLTFHYETREQQLYALVVAKGGPKLQESTDDQSRIRKGRGTITSHSVGLGMLALTLSNELGRRVIDKTGLTSKYDFELSGLRRRVNPQRRCQVRQLKARN
jgi:uncharacterized protein (TIGR03435 family)